MNSLVIDTWFIDALLVLMAIEAMIVIGLRRFAGRGPATASFLCTLFAGAFLLLAMRNALAGASTASVAGALLLAFAAHLSDLALRWGKAPAEETQVDGQVERGRRIKSAAGF